jgi:ribosomal-protein-alanine N-acetyltransferase
MDDNEQVARQPDDTCLFLHEDNICLFPFGTEELYSEDYLKWMNDLDITKTIGRFDYLMPVDRAKLVEYYNDISKENTIFLAIYLKSDGSPGQIKKMGMKFIGTLKIYDIDLLAKRASLGIAIGDKLEWGKGCAGKAIHIASRYIFEVLGLRKISAGYIASNIGMERAFLKNGFGVEAVFKEHVYFEGQYVDHKFVCKFRG